MFFQVRSAFLHRNKLPTRFSHKIYYLGLGMTSLNPKSHPILAIGLVRRASGVNAVSELPFETAVNSFTYQLVLLKKIKICVFLTLEAM